VSARTANGRLRERGQSLLEFALVLPLMLLILTGILEFGVAFNHNLTLEYATREGARTGAALADGGGDAAVCSTIDAQIVAAVQRVLTAPGSAVVLSRVSSVSIWRSTASGQTDASVGVFTWVNTGPSTGPTVDSQSLTFSPPSPLPGSWQPCSRVSAGATPDSIGVSLSYTYNMTSPMGSIMRFFGGPGAAALPMADRTVMALNPNSQ
jgi:Flp pilus assembly protein TadG